MIVDPPGYSSKVYASMSGSAKRGNNEVAKVRSPLHIPRMAHICRNATEEYANLTELLECRTGLVFSDSSGSSRNTQTQEIVGSRLVANEVYSHESVHAVDVGE